jgi:diguanylate cyclase (GGDEF)-like protein
MLYNTTVAGTILVVEGDTAQRQALGAMLTQIGYDATLCATGRDGLRQFRRQRPQLVIASARLPDMDALPLVRRLKRTGAFVPVVLLTDAADMERRARGIDAGADELLERPRLAFDLELRLRSLLRIKALTDELALKNERLLELAHTDPLTSVPNRRAVLEELKREVGRSARYGTPVSVLLLDLDHFKQVNDRFGHAAGDRVLREAAQELERGIRHEDRLGRFGGEEFLVVAPCIGEQEAVRMAERLRARIAARPIEWRGDDICITASVGVAACPGGVGRSANALLEAADGALYEAKARGRNQVAAAREGAAQHSGRGAAAVAVDLQAVSAGSDHQRGEIDARSDRDLELRDRP